MFYANLPEIIGNKPVKEYTKSDFTIYSNLLHKFPKNVTKMPEYRGKSMTEIVKIIKDGKDEFKIFNTLILNFGLRYDKYTTFGSTINPRAALIYNPLEQTTIKLLYGEAFRAPIPSELYYNDGNITQKANPNLKPELIKTYEIVLGQSLGQGVLVEASLFHNDIKNLITMETDPADGLIVYNNVESLITKGAELQLEKAWDNGIKGTIGYNYQQTKNALANQTVVNSPAHLIKANLMAPLFKLG
ncbi:TonB-dependent receptor [Candidatus Magnetobacterium bavaricum]|uniref:TonB-dependent receptor n=1 Tax=Candidatus Magnetobacterium bavaricum TaxID=29290 RepID=A0A0F3H0A5_9BACT|nr:TonB-dependent receptor [Candidatus Magnetobacterium bavaricum]